MTESLPHANPLREIGGHTWNNPNEAERNAWLTQGVHTGAFDTLPPPEPGLKTYNAVLAEATGPAAATTGESSPLNPDPPEHTAPADERDLARKEIDKLADALMEPGAFEAALTRMIEKGADPQDIQETTILTAQRAQAQKEAAQLAASNGLNMGILADVIAGLRKKIKEEKESGGGTSGEVA